MPNWVGRTRSQLSAGLIGVAIACSPVGPSRDEAIDAVGLALGEELAEPYVILALKLASDDQRRHQMESLAHRLFHINALTIVQIFQTSTGIWRGQMRAEIICALESDDEVLERRDMLALAMGYRSLCARGTQSNSRPMERGFALERRAGIWLAELDPPISTKR